MASYAGGPRLAVKAQLVLMILDLSVVPINSGSSGAAFVFRLRRVHSTLMCSSAHLVSWLAALGRDGNCRIVPQPRNASIAGTTSIESPEEGAHCSQ